MTLQFSCGGGYGYLSNADYERGFLDGLRYVKDKIVKQIMRKTTDDVAGVFNRLIAALQEKQFKTIDEAVMEIEVD